MKSTEFMFLHTRPTWRRHAHRADDDYGATASPDWRAVDWRSHLRDTEVAGRRIHYVDIGDPEAPPAVLIHGLGGSWQNWLEMIPRLAETRRVIALDLPGHGRSQMPREKISITGFADCVNELCTQLGIESAAVVGNSLGGFTGAEFAIRNPQRVERLTLISAAGITIRDLRRQPLLTGAKLLAWVGARGASTQDRAVGRPDVRHASAQDRALRRPGVRHAIFACVFRHPTRIAADLVLEQFTSPPAAGFVSSLEALISYDYVDRLPEIVCPTLIIWGREDALVPVRDAYEYERLIPDARAVVLDDTGHVAMMERPRTVNELVTAFFDETGGASEQTPEHVAAEAALAESPSASAA